MVAACDGLNSLPLLADVAPNLGLDLVDPVYQIINHQRVPAAAARMNLTCPLHF
jgi:hypothetical protein